MTDDVSETAASLHILGDDLDPDEVTGLLGYEPTTRRRKGDYWSTPNGRSVKARTGSWSRSVEYRMPGDLDGQICEILEPLTNDLATWKSLSKRFDVYLFLGVFIRAYNQCAELRPETLLAIGERGIRMDFDIYSQVPPDEEPTA